MFVNRVSGLVVASFLLYRGASATIQIGTWHPQSGPAGTVAWIDGQDPCHNPHTSLTVSGNNFCGIPFTLDNGFTYEAQGCGGPLWLVNGDGSFNHDCVSQSHHSSCSVFTSDGSEYTTLYSC